ncbi:MAG: AAA family ATPase [Cellulomonas sp.]|nr:AAA family ATPase [Cellulomonas sp.]
MPLPIRRVEFDPDPADGVDPASADRPRADPDSAAQDNPAWYLQIPAVQQVVREGWDLAQITVLVGENGAGKSTLIEALAGAVGMGPEGGSIGSGFSTRVSESPLAGQLRLVREPGSSRRGYFLRAETMHAFYTYLEQNPGGRWEPRFHEMSHGESFLGLIEDRMKKAGLYLLDEPESALSFTSCLGLLSHLRGLADRGSQIVLSTHSPVLAALPGAQVWEVGDWGMRQVEWASTDLVMRWQGFLADPERYLRHLSG